MRGFENDSRRYGASGAPTEYEHDVLNLRAGDTVVYDGVRYKLGKFLGRGNATHIFALADDPEHVIRIPYLAENIYDGFVSDADKRLPRAEKGKVHVAIYVEAMKKQAGGIPFKADPQNRFVIAKRIYGSEDGQSFIYRQRVGDRKIDLADIKSYFKQTSVENQEQGRQLIDLMQKNHEISEVKTNEGTEYYVGEVFARQYIWDTHDNCWYKVDAE